MEVYRQGDVVIRKLAETDADDVQEHQSILARGEVTGHAHRPVGNGGAMGKRLSSLPMRFWNMRSTLRFDSFPVCMRSFDNAS
jgi:hypothetical protein